MRTKDDLCALGSEPADLRVCSNSDRIGSEPTSRPEQSYGCTRTGAFHSLSASFVLHQACDLLPPTLAPTLSVHCCCRYCHTFHHCSCAATATATATQGILSTRLFTILVLMAIATTMLTSPLVWAIFLRRYPGGREECDQGETTNGVTCDMGRCDVAAGASHLVPGGVTLTPREDVEMCSRSSGQVEAKGSGGG